MKTTGKNKATQGSGAKTVQKSIDHVYKKLKNKETRIALR
jgi:hypothetical protein